LKRHHIWCNEIFTVVILLGYSQYHETLRVP
jgi:hypothetical protein